MASQKQLETLTNYGFHADYVSSLSSIHAHRLIHQLHRIAKSFFKGRLDLTSSDVKEAIAINGDVKVADLVKQLVEASK